MENINGEAMPSFDPMARFPSLDLANKYLGQHGKADAFAAIADQGEYILIARKAKAESPEAPKADPKPRKGPAKAKGKGKKAEAPKEGPKAEGKPKGKQSAAQRIAAQGDLKPKAKAEGPKADPIRWRKLDLDPAQGGRKWIGPWADRKADAEKGKGPDAGPAKADLANAAIADWRKASEGAFGGIFCADTHWPFRKRIAALAALIRAKDIAGLKKLEIKEISTTPIMLGKLRDLAIAALSAKAEKAKGNGKAKADPAPEAQAPQSS
jgi:hypothetical protein